MKRFLVFCGLLIVAVVAVVSVFGGVGTGTLIAMPAVVLDTQQIVFMRSLQEEYVKIDTWLNDAQDLSSFVVNGQTLRFPEAGAAPAVYKNRTTDVDSVEPSETTYDVSLDYYDSQNYKMRNINMHALPFNKMQYYTNKSANSIRLKEVNDAAYAFAPDEAGNKKIIIATTGGARDGFKMLTLSDIVVLARACDNAQFPDGRNLVLPSDMWWDLVQNNEILKAQLSYQQNTGTINPNVVNYYGFKIHKATDNSIVAYDIDASAKAAQGALITGNVVPAGFVFCTNEVFRAGGDFEMFLLNKAQNPTGRADEFGFAHRFKADFTKDAKRYSAMVYQAISA
ncbi:MAG: hypothetical protein PHH37_08350 [Paludibacter sp.]|nr:hypothetical protein [Paludibacter sp.]